MVKKGLIVGLMALVAIGFSFGFTNDSRYRQFYLDGLDRLNIQLSGLADSIRLSDLNSEGGRESLLKNIHQSRLTLKGIDIWIRYLDPIAYRRVNGPLQVEWENEVFEKFEPPYKREGSGLSLLELYLREQSVNRDSAAALIEKAIGALNIFRADSVTSRLTAPNFLLANRLFILNLAAIYTTGFECPARQEIIPELAFMLETVKKIYNVYNQSFAGMALPAEYLDLYDNTLSFVKAQPGNFSKFDHFHFLRDYVNPLFRLNQQLINKFGVVSASFNDYSLSNECYSIFDKSLFQAENVKGIYSLVEDEELLRQIKQTGKLLFYDPILSGNNKRSCASCHKPGQFFTDTSTATALQFDGQQHLPRNTISLVNAVFNHLVMLDGKHISLQGQARDVIKNAIEMNCNEKDLLRKVQSCREYREAFKKFTAFTPEEPKFSIEHIIAAITYYYGDFSNYYSPFDDAMNDHKPLEADAQKGFNLFMGKAQCGTCHFVPHFNGIMPPFLSSEFEVLGVPADTAYKMLSPDKGRFLVNPAPETLHAFRTGTVRNAEFTKPYMHNGVFNNLDQLIDFYNAGGGVGKKLLVPNQTLAADSLRLTHQEVQELFAFIHSLNERVNFDKVPNQLPQSSDKDLNRRQVGGEY